MRLVGDLFFWTDGACPKEICVYTDKSLLKTTSFVASQRIFAIARSLELSAQHHCIITHCMVNLILSFVHNDDEEFNNLLATRPAP